MPDLPIPDNLAKLNDNLSNVGGWVNSFAKEFGNFLRQLDTLKSFYTVKDSLLSQILEGGDLEAFVNGTKVVTPKSRITIKQYWEIFESIDFAQWQQLAKNGLGISARFNNSLLMSMAEQLDILSNGSAAKFFKEAQTLLDEGKVVPTQAFHWPSFIEKNDLAELLQRVRNLILNSEAIIAPFITMWDSLQNTDNVIPREFGFQVGSWDTEIEEITVKNRSDVLLKKDIERWLYEKSASRSPDLASIPLRRYPIYGVSPIGEILEIYTGPDNSMRARILTNFSILPTDAIASFELQVAIERTDNYLLYLEKGLENIKQRSKMIWKIIDSKGNKLAEFDSEEKATSSELFMTSKEDIGYISSFDEKAEYKTTQQLIIDARERLVKLRRFQENIDRRNLILSGSNNYLSTRPFGGGGGSWTDSARHINLRQDYYNTVKAVYGQRYADSMMQWQWNGVSERNIVEQYRLGTRLFYGIHDAEFDLENLLSHPRNPFDDMGDGSRNIFDRTALEESYFIKGLPSPDRPASQDWSGGSILDMSGAEQFGEDIASFDSPGIKPINKEIYAGVGPREFRIFNHQNVADIKPLAVGGSESPFDAIRNGGGENIGGGGALPPESLNVPQEQPPDFLAEKLRQTLIERAGIELPVDWELQAKSLNPRKELLNLLGMVNQPGTRTSLIAEVLSENLSIPRESIKLTFERIPELNGVAMLNNGLKDWEVLEVLINEWKMSSQDAINFKNYFPEEFSPALIKHIREIAANNQGIVAVPQSLLSKEAFEFAWNTGGIKNIGEVLDIWEKSGFSVPIETIVAKTQFHIDLPGKLPSLAIGELELHFDVLLNKFILGDSPSLEVARDLNLFGQGLLLPRYTHDIMAEPEIRSLITPENYRYWKQSLHRVIQPEIKTAITNGWVESQLTTRNFDLARQQLLNKTLSEGILPVPFIRRNSATDEFTKIAESLINHIWFERAASLSPRDKGAIDAIRELAFSLTEDIAQKRISIEQARQLIDDVFKTSEIFKKFVGNSERSIGETIRRLIKPLHDPTIRLDAVNNRLFLKEGFFDWTGNTGILAHDVSSEEFWKGLTVPQEKNFKITAEILEGVFPGAKGLSIAPGSIERLLSSIFNSVPLSDNSGKLLTVQQRWRAIIGMFVPEQSNTMLLMENYLFENWLKLPPDEIGTIIGGVHREASATSHRFSSTFTAEYSSYQMLEARGLVSNSREVREILNKAQEKRRLAIGGPSDIAMHDVLIPLGRTDFAKLPGDWPSWMAVNMEIRNKKLTSFDQLGSYLDSDFYKNFINNANSPFEIVDGKVGIRPDALERLGIKPELGVDAKAAADSRAKIALRAQGGQPQILGKQNPNHLLGEIRPLRLNGNGGFAERNLFPMPEVRIRTGPDIPKGNTVTSSDIILIKPTRTAGGRNPMSIGQLLQGTDVFIENLWNKAVNERTVFSQFEMDELSKAVKIRDGIFDILAKETGKITKVSKLNLVNRPVMKTWATRKMIGSLLASIAFDAFLSKTFSHGDLQIDDPAHSAHSFDAGNSLAHEVFELFFRTDGHQSIYHKALNTREQLVDIIQGMSQSELLNEVMEWSDKLNEAKQQVAQHYAYLYPGRSTDEILREVFNEGSDKKYKTPGKGFQLWAELGDELENKISEHYNEEITLEDGNTYTLLQLLEQYERLRAIYNNLFGEGKSKNQSVKDAVFDKTVPGVMPFNIYAYQLAMRDERFKQLGFLPMTVAPDPLLFALIAPSVISTGSSLQMAGQTTGEKRIGFYTIVQPPPFAKGWSKVEENNLAEEYKAVYKYRKLIAVDGLSPLSAAKIAFLDLKDDLAIKYNTLIELLKGLEQKTSGHLDKLSVLVDRPNDRPELQEMSSLTEQKKYEDLLRNKDSAALVRLFELAKNREFNDDRNFGATIYDNWTMFQWLQENLNIKFDDIFPKEVVDAAINLLMPLKNETPENARLMLSYNLKEQLGNLFEKLGYDRYSDEFNELMAEWNKYIYDKSRTPEDIIKFFLIWQFIEIEIWNGMQEYGHDTSHGDMDGLSDKFNFIDKWKGTKSRVDRFRNIIAKLYQTKYSNLMQYIALVASRTEGSNFLELLSIAVTAIEQNKDPKSAIDDAIKQKNNNEHEQIIAQAIAKLYTVMQYLLFLQLAQEITEQGYPVEYVKTAEDILLQVDKQLKEAQLPKPTISEQFVDPPYFMLPTDSANAGLPISKPAITPSDKAVDGNGIGLNTGLPDQWPTKTERSEWFGAMQERDKNLPPVEVKFPDYSAPDILTIGDEKVKKDRIKDKPKEHIKQEGLSLDDQLGDRLLNKKVQQLIIKDPDNIVREKVIKDVASILDDIREIAPRGHLPNPDGFGIAMGTSTPSLFINSAKAQDEIVDLFIKNPTSGDKFDAMHEAYAKAAENFDKVYQEIQERLKAAGMEHPAPEDIKKLNAAKDKALDKANQLNAFINLYNASAKYVDKLFKDAEASREWYQGSGGLQDIKKERKEEKIKGTWTQKDESQYQIKEKRARDDYNQQTREAYQAYLKHQKAFGDLEKQIQQRELRNRYEQYGGRNGKKPNGHSYGCMCSACKKLEQSIDWRNATPRGPQGGGFQSPPPLPPGTPPYPGTPPPTGTGNSPPLPPGPLPVNWPKPPPAPPPPNTADAVNADGPFHDLLDRSPYGINSNGEIGKVEMIPQSLVLSDIININNAVSPLCPGGTIAEISNNDEFSETAFNNNLPTSIFTMLLTQNNLSDVSEMGQGQGGGGTVGQGAVVQGSPARQSQNPPSTGNPPGGGGGGPKWRQLLLDYHGAGITGDKPGSGIAMISEPPKIGGGGGGPLDNYQDPRAAAYTSADDKSNKSAASFEQLLQESLSMEVTGAGGLGNDQYTQGNPPSPNDITRRSTISVGDAAGNTDFDGGPGPGGSIVKILRPGGSV